MTQEESNARKDYPAANFKNLEGKTIQTLVDLPDADEGLKITFTDGTTLSFGFCGCEGDIEVQE